MSLWTYGEVDNINKGEKMRLEKRGKDKRCMERVLMII